MKPTRQPPISADNPHRPMVLWLKCRNGHHCGFPPIQLRFVREGIADAPTCYWQRCGAAIDDERLQPTTEVLTKQGNQ